MKGLTRVDHDGKKMYGWLVRAYGGGKTFSKYFSDSKYGGREKARERAVTHLEKLQTEVEERFVDFIPRQNMPGYRKRPGTANESGLVGIHRCETVSRGKEVAYWAATWKEDGKPKDKTFYFNNSLRSEEDARRLAIEWRARKIIELSHDSRLERLLNQHDKGIQRGPLRSWVAGLEIADWSPYLRRYSDTSDRQIKKREPLNEKRIEELINFLGITAAHFDWDEIDYDFGRGIFKGDIRSRCFWNRRGIRTDVLIDDEGRLLIEQGTESDPYYFKELGRQRRRRRPSS